MIGDDQITIKNHRSGGILPILTFNLYNYHQNVMLFDSSIEVKGIFNIQVSDMQYNKQLYSFDSNGKITYSENGFTLKDVLLVGEPNSLVTLSVTSSLINQ